MTYELDFKEKAISDIAFLKKNEPQVFNKLVKLLDELREHPYSGTGKPELLKYKLSGQWSRRITHHHRLMYEVHEGKVTVVILSALGHYSAK